MCRHRRRGEPIYRDTSSRCPKTHTWNENRKMCRMSFPSPRPSSHFCLCPRVVTREKKTLFLIALQLLHSCCLCMKSEIKVSWPRIYGKLCLKWCISLQHLYYNSNWQIILEISVLLESLGGNSRLVRPKHRWGYLKWNFSRLLAPIHDIALTKGPHPLWIEVRTKDLNIQCNFTRSFQHQAQQE